MGDFSLGKLSQVDGSSKEQSKKVIGQSASQTMKTEATVKSLKHETHITYQ